MLFRDRVEAGQRLSTALEAYRHENPIVLALPRGGVPVGFEVAIALRYPLDVIIARKIGAPDQPEFAIGAIAPGASVLNEAAIDYLGVSAGEVERIVASETQELHRRAALYRRGRPPPSLGRRTAIVVDDGLATGATAAAAIESARTGAPARVVLAVPVGASDSVASVRGLADDVVCLHTPADFRAVSQWYGDFHQTSDDDVIDLLERAAAAQAARVN